MAVRVGVGDAVAAGESVGAGSVVRDAGADEAPPPQPAVARTVTTAHARSRVDLMPRDSGTAVPARRDKGPALGAIPPADGPSTAAATPPSHLPRIARELASHHPARCTLLDESADALRVTTRTCR
jgi:hypothetical protein